MFSDYRRLGRDALKCGKPLPNISRKMKMDAVGLFETSVNM